MMTITGKFTVARFDPFALENLQPPSGGLRPGRIAAINA
jgi:hypothetical protein